MNDFLLATGVITCLVCGWAVLLLAVIGCCRLSNKVSHMVLDAYGGWRTFQKFRKWYWERPENQKEAA